MVVNYLVGGASGLCGNDGNGNTESTAHLISESFSGEDEGLLPISKIVTVHVNTCELKWPWCYV